MIMLVPQKIEISPRTIIFTVVFLISLQILWLVRDFIFSLFIALIIMSAVRPLVTRLERFHIPRTISTVVIFIFTIFLIGCLFFGLVPVLITETALLARTLPELFEQLDPALVKSLNIKDLTQYVPNLTNQFFGLIGAVFSNTVFVLSTLFFSAYFVIEQNIVRSFLSRFIDEAQAVKIGAVFEKIEKRLSAWFWGELILMLVVGILTLIGLNLIGLRHAIPLAIVAGMFEVVPNLGPVLSTVPAILIAATQSYFLILPTIALYFIVQQLENNLIVPYIMRKAVNLHPVITLAALVVGGKIGGILGVLLAIPLTLVAETVLVEYINSKKSAEKLR